MIKLFKPLRLLTSAHLYSNRIPFPVQFCNQKFMTSYSRKQIQAKRDFLGISPLGWFLLLIPTSTLGLGTWQVFRKQWKEDLMAKLHKLTNLDPVQLPQDLSEIEEMEYRPVHVRGEFQHDKELHFGPRTLVEHGDAATKSQLISGSNKTGYLIITPFKLADREETILVNRGWVPVQNKKASSRPQGQEKGEVDVIGIVRLSEHRPNFVPKNQREENQWYYKDLNQMAEVTGAVPVLLDATNDFDKPEGPFIGGQTRVTLRNEHLSYIFTWYGLSAATSYLWFLKFVKRVAI